MLIMLISWVVIGVVFGFATNMVLINRGYNENWFWWGFFFGIIALIVALSKPDANQYSASPYNSNASQTAKTGSGWKCSCGTSHVSYVGSCGCGKTKADIMKQLDLEKLKLVEEEKAKQTENENRKAQEQELLDLQKLNEYKKMLDSGIITQEEFSIKKKQVLGL